jgi:hypothetical protein
MNRRSFLGLGAKLGLAVAAAAVVKPAEAVFGSQGVETPGAALEAPTIAPAAISGPSLPVLEAATRLSEPQDYPQASQQLAQLHDQGLVSFKEFRDTRYGSQDFGTFQQVYPEFVYEPATVPNKVDPLGQWGAVAIKYTVNGEKYQDWIGFNTVNPSPEDIAEAKARLLEKSAQKLALIEPRAYFVSTASYYHLYDLAA